MEGNFSEYLKDNNLQKMASVYNNILKNSSDLYLIKRDDSEYVALLQDKDREVNPNKSIKLDETDMGYLFDIIDINSDTTEKFSCHPFDHVRGGRKFTLKNLEEVVEKGHTQIR